MLAYQENFIIDKSGKRVGIILEIEAYRQLLEAVEELAEIRAYDKAKASDDDIIPFEQAISEIERKQ
ncbi:MAG: hypothetical protein ACE5EY_04525 [Anaerolineae bacterium]